MAHVSRTLGSPSCAAVLAAIRASGPAGMSSPEVHAQVLSHLTRYSVGDVLRTLVRNGLVDQTHSVGARHGRWCLPEHVEALRAAVDAEHGYSEQRRERRRETNRRQMAKKRAEVSASASNDPLPIIRKLVPASGAKPVRTLAANSVFDWAGQLESMNA